MKKLIFTLMMMAGLAILAGTAMAVNEVSVYQGGTYTYNLSGLTINGANSEADIEFENTVVATITMNSGFTYQTGGSDGMALPATFDAPSSISAANFSIKFDDAATTGVDSLIVTITDGESSCFNYIKFGINILPKPTYNLDIAAVTAGFDPCQEREGAGHNNPNATVETDDEENTFTFEVTSTISGIPNGESYSYDYTINLPTSTLNSFQVTEASGITLSGGVVSGSGTGTGSDIERTDVFTVTFNTTTGAASENIVASLTLTTDNAELVPGNGGGIEVNAGTTTAGTTDEASVTVNAVPAIGGFTNP